ncbi:penicillin-binding protein 2 [Pseudoruegeria sp. SHC-113]|uniref:penicillin-binding protein 2 n=1 Tax=Pseudoruegeria sp. SHC-113 TaxID=2855439 RepID=UPI0021BB6E67|nr:penicillin-binding protein 2 [Pseudoruegeria sp. SHC-113]MCT8161098.1 penicillin-binding protein 2 [Pseudoruegeria sp. SHC-113]
MKRSPKDTAESTRRISRRGLLVGGIQLAFIGVLGMRMRQLQVKEADQYRLLAEENRINIRLLPPPRGLIHDRNGITVADNTQNYRIVMVREDAGDVDEVIARLQQLVYLEPADLERARKEIKRRSPFVPVTVTDRISWDELSRVAVNSPALPGITPEVGLSRYYPQYGDYAHIVGYVGPVSDYDLSKIDDQDPLLQIPKFQIGKTGIETKMEKALRGSAGAKQIEVNAVGRVMRELGRREGDPGENLRLTIDSKLQNYVQARLGEESATAVVLDTRTGDILAAGSTPSFDPNKFVRGISVKDYSELTGNKYRPLANKSVQGTYPPGSTFKMVVALAALEAGAVTAQDTVYCPGYMELGDRRFHCWKRGGHGHVNLNASLEQSCDVYYYDLSLRIGVDKIAEMARKLGLGERFDVEMSAVAEGLIPTRAWKQEVRGQSWLKGDTLNASIGQGFVLASPLQLAVMTARLATGKEVVPRLIKSVNDVEQPVLGGADLGFNKAFLREVQEGMYNVSNSRRGTAYSMRIVEDAFRMAGKTGTSQVRNITAAERARGVVSNADLPWERRDHALYVSYAPYDDPRIAVSVVVEHGGGGSTAAAPVARDIVLQALYGGTPPLSAYPEKDRGRIESQQDKMELRDFDSFGEGQTRA